MLHLKANPNNPPLPKSFCKASPCIRTNRSLTYKDMQNGEQRGTLRERQRRVSTIVPSSSSASASSETEEKGLVGQSTQGKFWDNKGQFGNLVTEFGWRVRRLVEEEDEMWKAAHVQAEAFHVPIAFFNDFSFELFKEEVLFSLNYRLRKSARNRYACLVAEAADDSDLTSTSERPLVGIVDATVMREDEVLSHLEGAEEYLYITGIAVLKEFRRRKVATVLLKACDLLSLLWGFDYLVLRAYEDDSAARKVYTDAGYRVVSGDPHWMTTWIGRKRRVLMIKKSPLRDWF